MKGLLLDTNVFLWYSSNDLELPSKVQETIDNAESAYVSTMSAWEIAIKLGLEKLVLPGPIESLLDVSSNGLTFLEPSVAEYVGYSRLGFPVRDHRDPFDRMLVVQALKQNLQLVTSDKVFHDYLPTEQVLLIQKT